MKTVFSKAMRHAAQLTRSQNLIEATRVIQRALSGRNESPQPEHASPTRPQLIEFQSGDAAETSASFEHVPQEAKIAEAPIERGAVPQAARPLEQVSKLLQAALPGLALDSGPLAKSPQTRPVAVPDGADFLMRTFTCAAGTRDYKIYVPSHKAGGKLPLVIMLHGCTQNPDDFAVGTGMNRLAEEHGFIVAYPRQTMSANQSACWNWFKQTDQMRDGGEPSIIAGITRAIMAEFDVDAARVYVAGLSAGGAMAAIMGATYPELYAATGIHSGLPCGSASDVASAFAAMRGTAVPASPGRKKHHHKSGQDRVRTIVFHGASDQTVHPSNAEIILAHARAGLSEAAQEIQHDGIAGGRTYTRTVITDASGIPHAEHWAIAGLGHAWSGGNPDGSYTDQQGPDASREMLRFFWDSAREPSTR